MRISNVLNASVIIIFSLLVACGDEAKDENLRKELGDAKKATQDYVDQTLKGWKSDLEQLDDDLRQLKADAQEKAGEMSDEARQKFDASADKLAEQRRQLSAKIEKAQEASLETWDDFEAEFQSGWKKMKQSFEDLKKSMN